jgi:hypothetical protein
MNFGIESAFYNIRRMHHVCREIILHEHVSRRQAEKVRNPDDRSETPGEMINVGRAETAALRHSRDRNNS